MPSLKPELKDEKNEEEEANEKRKKNNTQIMFGSLAATVFPQSLYCLAALDCKLGHVDKSSFVISSFKITIIIAKRKEESHLISIASRNDIRKMKRNHTNWPESC